MKNSAMLTIVIGLLVLAVGYGVLRNTVANNSRDIGFLRAESNQRMAILQKVDTNLQLLMQRLEGHEAKKGH